MAAGFCCLASLYFILTSGACFKGLILPRIERELRARITVESADWSPWRGFSLKGLRLQTTGTSPLLEAARVEIPGSFWNWRRGEWKFGALTLTRPVLNLVREADGTSNLDALLQAVGPDTSAGRVWSIESLEAREGMVTLVQNVPDGRAWMAQAGGLTLEAGPMEPGATTSWKVSAQARADLRASMPGAQAIDGGVEARGDFSISKVGQFEGITARFVWRPDAPGALAAQGEARWMAQRLERSTIELSEGNRSAGHCVFWGGPDPASGDWVFNTSARDIPGRLLQSFLPWRDVDLAGTLLNGTNTVKLAGGWDAPRARLQGRWQAQGLTITRAGATTPPTEAVLDFTLHAGAAQGTLDFDQADLAASSQGRQLLTGRLAGPLKVNWKTGAWTGPAALELRLQDVDIAQWQPVLGGVAHAGRLSLQLDTRAAKDGGVDYAVGASAFGLAARHAELVLEQSDFSLSATGNWNGDRLTLRKAGVRHRAGAPDGNATQTQLENLEMALLSPGPGGEWRAEFAAEIQHEQGAGAVRGGLAGSARWAGSALRLPSAAEVNASFHAAHATGVFAEASGLHTRLFGKWTPGQVEQVSLRLERGGAPLGGMHARGSLDAEGAWQLDLGIDAVDRRLLNFVGAPWGMDFRGTVLEATNHVRLAAGGRQGQVRGRAGARDFSVARQGAVTPPMQLQTDYEVSWDRTEPSVQLQKFSLTGYQDARQILLGRLLQPMTLSGARPGGVGDGSQLEIALTGLDLQAMRPLLGSLAQAGQVDGLLRLRTTSAGWPLEVNGTFDARNLATGPWKGSALQVQMQGSMTNATQFRMTRGRAQWRDAGGLLQSVEAAGDGSWRESPRIELTRLTGEYHEGRTLGARFALAGQFDTRARIGSVAFQLADISPRLLSAPGVLPEVPWRTALGEANGTVAISVDGAAQFETRLQLTGVHLEHPAWPQEELGLAALVQGTLRRHEGGGWDAQVQRMGGGWRWGAGAVERFELAGGARRQADRWDVGLARLLLADVTPVTLQAVGFRQAGGTTLANGILSFEGSAQCASDGRSGVAGKFTGAGLALDDAAGHWREGRMHIACDVELLHQRRQDGGWSLRVGKLEGTGGLEGGHNATFSLSGGHDTARAGGDWQIRLNGLDAPLLRPLLAPVYEMQPLKSGVVSVELGIEALPGGASQLEGKLSVRDWRWAGVPGPAPPDQNATVEFEAVRTAGGRKVELRRCLVDLPDSAQAKNELHISGVLDLAKPGEIRGELAAESPSLELERLLQVLDALPPSRQPRKPAALRWQLAVRRLYWSGLSAEDCTAHQIQNGKVIDFENLRMKLEGGAVAGRYQLDFSGAIQQHDLALAGKGISPLPFLLQWPVIRDQLSGTMVAWIRGQKGWGELAGDLRLRWRQDEFAKGLVTSSVNEGKPAQLQLVGTKVRLPEGEDRAGLFTKVLLLPLAAVAQGLEVDKLRGENFADIQLGTRLERGRWDLHLRLDGASLRLQTAGAVQLAEPSGQSRVDLPVGIALAPSLARKVRLAGGLLKPDEYYQLPIFQHIQGTMGDLQMVTDKVVVAELLIRGLGMNTANVPFEILRMGPGLINPTKLPQLLDLLPLPMRPWELLFPPPKK